VLKSHEELANLLAVRAEQRALSSELRELKKEITVDAIQQAHKVLDVRPGEEVTLDGITKVRAKPVEEILKQFDLESERPVALEKAASRWTETRTREAW
jgi:hypothetical protein